MNQYVAFDFEGRNRMRTDIDLVKASIIRLTMLVLALLVFCSCTAPPKRLSDISINNRGIQLPIDACVVISMTARERAKIYTVDNGVRQWKYSF